MKKWFRLLCGCTMLIVMAGSYAADNFKIENIELSGARRITLATVVTYLPLGIGDTLTPALTQEVMKSLYDTGFFKDIELRKRGNVLLIKVVERPAIASIDIKGNRKIKKEDITKAFDEAGLSAGRIYNDSVLQQMKQELERLYYSFGRYGVKIDAKVTDLARNRVSLRLDIAEGVSAKIRQLNIVGNTIFSDEELLDQLESGIPGFFAFFSSKDEYAKTKLNGDREKLRSYYHDRGYAKFNIESTQVTISPDKKDLYITINVSEGDLYKIRDVKLAGKMVISEERVKQIVDVFLVKGELYSRKNITDLDEYLRKVMGNVGYAFAEVKILPDIDSASQNVDLVVNLDPNKRTYVRRIRFEGNEDTSEDVYRREMRQMEGAWSSASQIERSRIRIQRLRFVEEVEVETAEVPGVDDQIDVVYKIKERLSGNFQIGLGYNDFYGTSFNLSINQDNLFGSGNSLGLSASSSSVAKNFSINYLNPYYTQDGISRGFNVFFRETDTSQTNFTSFLLNTYGGGVRFGIPVSEYSRANIGLDLARSEVLQSERFAGSQIKPIQDFIDLVKGTEYDTATLKLSYVIDSRNRAIFATKGAQHFFGVEWVLPGSDIEFYKFNYNGVYYLPVTQRTSFAFRADIAGGDALGEKLDGLPFFEKFASGGVNSLRGFETRSVGPRIEEKDPAFRGSQSGRRVFGGDFKTVGSIEYILPPPGGNQSAQIVIFYDFGNVFDTMEDFSFDQFRTSVGVAAKWLTPFGGLVFSASKPKKVDELDETKSFDFTISNNF